MRLKVSANAANEHIVRLLKEGHVVLKQINTDYKAKRAAITFYPARDSPQYRKDVAGWVNKVTSALNAIFPTTLEANRYASTRGAAIGIVGMNAEFNGITNHLQALITALEDMRASSIAQYTDLPIEARLYVDDIDSFSKVRDVKPEAAGDLLDKNGFFDRSEEEVQKMFEEILVEPLHKNDWGGETNDLYSPNIVLKGARIDGAFLLKGRGLRVPALQISDCGKMATKFSD
jgi:hypothetical protein